MDSEAVRREAVRLVRDGSAAEGLATLEAAAERATMADPRAATELLVEAASIALHVKGPARSVAIARRAVETARAVGGWIEVAAAIRLGDALSWAGRYDEATPVWQLAAAEHANETDPRILAERANASIRLGAPDAHDAAYRTLVAARGSGAHDAINDALNLVTVAEVQAGRLREALRAAEHGLAEVQGGTLDEIDMLGLLAWVTALLGDEERTRALVAAAERGLEALRITAAPGGHAQGILALSLGAPAEAIAAFEAKLVELRFGPIAAMTALRPFGADLVEAYVRAGRVADGRRALETMLPVALRSGQPRLAAPLSRAEGLVHEDEDAFRRALAWHTEWGNRFEEARTRLAFGELLRRRKRRAEARDQLNAAAAAFAMVDSTIWHRRAVAELRLAGERTPAAGAPLLAGPETLTRQEAEILNLLRAGLSNRAIAERLVLSIKTVEGHLTTIYGKLGVASRAQALAALSGDQLGPRWN